MKVLTISHSYFATENRKNLQALIKTFEVKVAIPNSSADRVLCNLNLDKANHSGHVQVFKRISLPRSQYLLSSFDLGMRKFAPDIVHIEYDPWATIFWQAELYRGLFARNSKLVCTVKKNTYRSLPFPLKWAKKAIAKFFLRRIDHLIAVNSGVRNIYRDTFGVSDNKITVMQHLGVDTDVFIPANRCCSNNNVIVIGYCGRLESHKGVEYLISTVQESRNKTGHEIELRLMGSGLLRSRLAKIGASWLKLLDPVSHNNVAGFMQQLDIFVLPSLVTPDHEEHDGHALMEAMSCGVACIGTTSGIIPEMLSGRAGLVAEPASISDLGEKLLMLLREPALRQELGQRARKKTLEEYSLNALAKLKSKIYEDIAV